MKMNIEQLIGFFRRFIAQLNALFWPFRRQYGIELTEYKIQLSIDRVGRKQLPSCS